MRKILILFGIIIVSFGMISCAPSNANGKSAYEIAVDNGFKGTEEEWLESLKGEDGKSLHILDIYNAAIESNEFQGTLLQFVEAYFSDVDIEGLSAYEVYKKNNPDSTLSEEQWLASLKGNPGNDGPKGDSIDLYSTYLELIKLGPLNGGLSESVTFLDFVKDYLNVDINSSSQKVVSKAILSAVKIVATNDKLFDSNGDVNLNATGKSGAGVIYRINKQQGSAYIITNYHVVFDSEDTNEVLSNIYINLIGDQYLKNSIKAKYIGGSATYDIAVLYIQDALVANSDAAAVELYDSNYLVAGTTAIAIGNPQGEGISVTEGIVSVDSEYIYMQPVSTEDVAVDELGEVGMRVIRIDTPVNSGNSGGGLFNENGQLIGIVNAKLMSSTVDNFGYAIPSNIAYNVAENIRRNYNNITSSKVVKPLIGIVTEAKNSYAEYDKVTSTTRIYEQITVAEVSPTSSLYGYLHVGDVIKSITFGGVTYEATRNFVLPDACLNANVGDSFTMKIIRDGIEMELVTNSFKEPFRFASSSIVG